MSAKTKQYIAIGAGVLAVLLFGGTVFFPVLLGSSTGDPEMMMGEAAAALEEMEELLAPGSFDLNARLFYAVYLLGIDGVKELDAAELLRCFVTEDGAYLTALTDEDEIWAAIETRYSVSITEAMREEYRSLTMMASQIGIYHGDGTSIVEVAASQVGQRGGEPYWRWYGCGSRQPWCAMFVSWCAEQCGYIDTGVIPKAAVANEEWYAARDQFMDRYYVPNPGDLIIFDWAFDGQDGLGDHIGIVESCDGETVYTIEGNAADQVMRLQYEVGHFEILGYGIPRYPTRAENVVEKPGERPTDDFKETE